MSHEINRVLRACMAGTWFINEERGAAIANVMALRALQGPRATLAFDEEHRAKVRANRAAPVTRESGNVAVINVHGMLLHRTTMVEDMSGPGAVSLERFQQTFSLLAEDPNVSGILLNIDSPGGQVEGVQETAAMIRGAQRDDRPIVAVANSMAASAAYWLAAAADEIVMTPSGQVGSIGVYSMHQNIAARLAAEGVETTFFYEGARKIEGNPFEPMSDDAKAARQASVRAHYEAFTNDVARFRGVPVEAVRADVSDDQPHYGAGRSYGQKEALRLGMVDRVATFSDVLAQMQSGKRRKRDNSGSRAMARRRMDMS